MIKTFIEESPMKELYRIELMINHFKKLSLVSRDFIINKISRERLIDLPIKK